MKGGLIIVVLIALLIVGVLVVKNLESPDSTGKTVKKTEAADMARDAADDVQKHVDATRKQTEN